MRDEVRDGDDEIGIMRWTANGDESAMGENGQQRRAAGDNGEARAILMDK